MILHYWLRQVDFFTTFPIIVIPFLLSAGISLWLTLYAIQKRRQSAVTALFAWIAGIATFWTSCYIGVLLSHDLNGKMFWTRLSYFSGQYSSVVVFLFSAKYNRAERWVNRRAISIYLGAGAPIVLLVLTNDLHHQIWQSVALVNGQIQSTYGSLFWLTLFYPYGFTLASLVLLLRSFIVSDGVYRLRSGLLVLGVLLPILVSVINDALGIILLPDFDATVFSLVFSGLLFAWALFRFKLLDFLPIASNAIIAHIRDGVLVFNTHNQIVSLNPSALNMLGVRAEDVVDANFDDILRKWSEPAWQKRREGQNAFEISQVQGSEMNTYELHFSPLSDRSRQEIGTILMIYNISEHKQLEQRLETLAISDPLTGCYNRRHFMHLATREMEKARRYCRPLTAIMIDLDHFKLVNDQYGHQAGDLVIQKVVELCLAHTRQADLFARYGGEEFVLLLTEMDELMACEVAKRILGFIAALVVATEKGPIQVTASIGVAGLFPSQVITLDQLLSHADTALYQAKLAGRNQVSLYQGND